MCVCPPFVISRTPTSSLLQKHVAYQCTVVLRTLIQPYLLRRMKKDVHAQLPPKTEQLLFCPLTPTQRRLYKSFLTSREVAEVLEGNLQPFRAIGLLRKICNHPDLFTAKEDGAVPEGYGHWEVSGKLRVAAKLLEGWAAEDVGNKVLFFCQGKQMLDIVEAFVQEVGYAYLRMDGDTSIRQRQRLIDAFNEDEDVFVFLLTTKVGGIGVNLTGANCVVIFDPDWNPSTDTQARERAWRLGQTRRVTIFKLIAP